MNASSAPVYLDCNATTPMELEVRDVVMHFMAEEYGNAGSRTHEYGLRAKQAVQRARDQVAAVVNAKSEEVVFTSGATESNNIALLGLARHGEQTGKKHIVTTAIEHKAVLEPLEDLESRGFEVTVLPVTRGGWVNPDNVKAALRADTLVVSVMHVNNETGVLQPLNKIIDALADHEAFLHVDAAQGYGKELDLLRAARIDLISVSGHKIYGPKGVGALVARRRGFRKVPLTPLMFGGGQEKGLRPGTLPTSLIVGLGKAAEIAVRDNNARRRRNEAIREMALRSLSSLDFCTNGDPERIIPHVLNVSFRGLDSEAAIVLLKDVASISNGSACTSQNYKPSHVLTAMGLEADAIDGAVRFSWCHLTRDIGWTEIARRVQQAR